MKHLVYVSILLCIVFSSCSNQKPVYEQTIQFPDFQWNRFHILEFKPEVKKVKKPFDFRIVITYTENYAYETIPVNTVLTYPNGQKNILRYVFPVKDKNGFIGTKDGNKRSIEASIHSNKQLPEFGIYTFTVQQLTQYYDLENIVSVHFLLIPSKKNKK